MVPLLLVSLLCAVILGLSHRRKGRCLLGTPATSISVMCRHPVSVSPAKGTLPAWYPYYTSISIMCRHPRAVSPAKGPDACLVPLPLVSLLCASILGLSHWRKAWCLLGTPTTVLVSLYVQTSWVCLGGARPGAYLVPLLIVSPLCAGILGLSRRRKAQCLLGTPTTRISFMCRHPGFVSPAEGPVPAWYPYYYYLYYVQASCGCLCGRRPSACLVPLLLVSLLCAGILGLSLWQKAQCLLGTTNTISIMCRHPGAVSVAEGPVPAWYPYY